MGSMQVCLLVLTSEVADVGALSRWLFLDVLPKPNP